jgi:hypothetical protein
MMAHFSFGTSSRQMQMSTGGHERKRLQSFIGSTHGFLSDKHLMSLEISFLQRLVDDERRALWQDFGQPRSRVGSISLWRCLGHSVKLHADARIRIRLAT